MGLRQSLTKRPPTTLRKLMDLIEQFIRVEEDDGNASVVPPEAPIRLVNSKPSARTSQVPKVTPNPTSFAAPHFKAFQTVFEEPIYKIMNKIKGEPFFVWPPKLSGDPATRDQKLQYSYHRERGYMTENCHKLKTHLKQLVSDGHLREYVVANLSSWREDRSANKLSGTSGMVPTGIIHVIHNPLCSSILPGSFRTDL